MEETKKREVYLLFSEGTEEDRNSFRNIVYNEIIVDREVIFEKRHREVPEGVKGILSIPPALLDPDMIELGIFLTAAAIKCIYKLINLIRRREEKISKNININMVIGNKTIIIKGESLEEEKIVKILKGV